MGDHPKYIVILSSGLEQAIVFAAILDHSQMAGMHTVVGAGRCSIRNHSNAEQGVSIEVFGKSVTLPNVPCRGEADAYAIRRALNLLD